jgi:hypothetical protein
MNSEQQKTPSLRKGSGVRRFLRVLCVFLALFAVKKEIKGELLAAARTG